MWLLFGVLAIVTAILNIDFSLKKKDNRWFMFLSLSLTALTVCTFYSDGAQRVIREDWGGLMDIMPTMSTALWVCVIASVLINGYPLLLKKEI